MFVDVGWLLHYCISDAPGEVDPVRSHVSCPLDLRQLGIEDVVEIIAVDISSAVALFRSIAQIENERRSCFASLAEKVRKFRSDAPTLSRRDTFGVSDRTLILRIDPRIPLTHPIYPKPSQRLCQTEKKHDNCVLF